jgi:lysophospholipase L1-like esterase
VYDYKVTLTAPTPASIATRTAGIATPVAGTAVANNAGYFSLDSVAAFDQVLSGLGTYTTGAGNIVVLVARVNAGNTMTLVSATVVAVSAAAATTTATAIFVPAGCAVGVRNGSAGLQYITSTADPNLVFTAADPTVNTAYSSAGSLSMGVKYTLSGDVKGKAELAYAATSTIEARYGVDQVIGHSNIVGTGSPAWGTYSVARQTPVVYAGFVTSIRIGLASAAAVEVFAATVNASGQLKKERSVTVSAAAGLNTLALKLQVFAGEVIGVRSASNYLFQFSNNPDGIIVWYYAAGDLPTAYTTVPATGAHRIEFAFTIQNGVVGRLTNLENAKTKIMETIDNTGAVDVTASLASARAATSVYIPSGTFNVTAVPAMGGGLYGDGDLFLNGKRFFLPAAPARRSLLSKLRAELATQISTGSMLIVIGDSKAHFAYASTGSKHWLDLLTSFVNIQVAPNDQPVMTALRPSSTYTPAFYGVTTAGTITTGTAGPISESAILAAGASLSFVGGYEQVDVCYTQQAGAGSLAFAFNGAAPYKTVVCAGATDLDHYSGPSLTGQAASGTYTITAVGGPVEVTALFRLGIKVPGSGGRLLVKRAAHGSYSLGSYPAAAIASVVKQASVFGGTKPMLLLALGINDILGGGTEAYIVGLLQSLIDSLQAAGVARIIVVVPFRPTGQAAAVLARYDAVLGLLAHTARVEGLQLIYEGDADWIGEGMAGDGIHLNDAGMVLMAQTVIEELAT